MITFFCLVLCTMFLLPFLVQENRPMRLLQEYRPSYMVADLIRVKYMSTMVL